MPVPKGRDVAMRESGRADHDKHRSGGSRRKPISPAFRMAVLAGAAESVRVHLYAGIDLDATDAQGRSALMLAATRGHLGVCKLLLEAGADPKTIDKTGNDALAMARSQGETGVEALLQRAPISSAEFQDENIEVGRNGSFDGPLDIPVTPSHLGVNNRADNIAERSVAESGLRNDTNRRDSWMETAYEPPDDDEFDLSGWDEEVEAEPPLDDVSCTDESATLQHAVSHHSPIDTDESWDDVDIEFPELGPRVRRRSRLGTETSRAVRVLVVEALRNGRVDGRRIRDTLTDDTERDDAKRADVEANLRLVLEDAGVVIGDDPFTTDAMADITDEDEDQFGDAATEAIELLDVLQSSNADPLVPYVRSLPADRLSREDEAALAVAIQAGMRRVFAAIAGSPAVASRVLLDARSVLEGNTPAGALFARANAQEDSDDTRSDVTESHQAERAVTAASIPTGLLKQLTAIVEICQQREVEQGTLAALLFDTALAPEYRQELQSIAEQDHACEQAATRIKAGLTKAMAAKRRFVEANLKLVIWVARQHASLPLTDRIQAGNIGLMRAVDRFDPNRGTKFSTYGVWWIRQAITRAIADTGRIIRLPVHVTESLRKVAKAHDLAHDGDGREDNAYRIAALVDLPPDKVRKMLAVPDDPLPMDEPRVMAEACAVPDEATASPEQMAMVAQMRVRVRQQLDGLTWREAAVLRRRFGIDTAEHTLEEVGKGLGVTRERIRQIEAKALKKLRHPTRSAHLAEFLE